MLETTNNNLTSQFSIEILRKYPTIAVLQRSVNKDYRIEHEEGQFCTLEKGTLVYIPNYAIHHDAEYFENPKEFKTNRFKKTMPRNMSWLPFGEGELNVFFFLIFFFAQFKLLTCS